MLTPFPGPWSVLFGRLTWASIPYNNPIIIFAAAFTGVAGLLIVGPVLYYRKIPYLFREWLTTVDHKKIGVMYIILGLVMMFRGFVDGMMIRTQQVMADGPNSSGYLHAAHGYLPPEHFDQIYSSHGTLMIIFAATPILTGLGNIIVPLQIGARDMAYPTMNAISLWLTVMGAMLVMASLFIGDFSQAGWVGLIPLTEVSFSPSTGVDYWMWAIQISSVGTTLNAINVIATIVGMRAPGMRWDRLPIFTWTTLSTSIIGLTSFPILGVALALLGADRYLGTHFFTAGLGGNLMLYTNLFWIWGHPEVYFLVLPAFGIISEVIPTFAEKPLFGYVTMVAATFAIAGISWTVWLHHFFTMGAGPLVNSFFSVATMIVGIPTGVKVFNWLFTLYRGRLTFATPMLWAVGALFLLLIGGLTGMMLAIPAVNYTVHNSVFVIAHFHCMVLLIVYAAFAAVTFWFPKVFGFRLDERAGKWFFASFSTGTGLLFTAMFGLGFMGETRRLDYLYDAHWFPALVIEEVGVAFYTLSCVFFFYMLFVSIRDRAKNTVGADAWGTARTLEWMTHSPVPFYNFAVTPQVNARDELSWRYANKAAGIAPDHFEAIHMPNNTPVPLIIGVFAFGFGFGLTWRIWWMAGLCLLGMIAVVIYRSFARDEGYVLSAETMARLEHERPLGVVSESQYLTHAAPPHVAPALEAV
jgi:cytochrome o ubiquinol oxidase subunit 1